jgi:hypothetical protein
MRVFIYSKMLGQLKIIQPSFHFFFSCGLSHYYLQKKKENDEFYRGLDILYDDDDIIRYGLEFSRNKKKNKNLTILIIKPKSESCCKVGGFKVFGFFLKF